MRNVMLMLCLTVFVLALAGCASNYTVVFKDGQQIYADNEPEYDPVSGFYEFEDLDGRKHKVNKDEIRTVHEGRAEEPAPVEEQTPPEETGIEK
jgi:Bacterial protein of unknown function (DUF903)